MVENAKEAEQTGNIRKLYQTLRRIGVKDASSIEDEFFSPEEFKEHFSKVSEDRFERPVNEILNTAEKTSLRDDARAKEAAKVLAREISRKEFDEELAKMRDGAPGIENVKVSAIKNASNEVKERVYRCVLQLLDTPANEWPRETKERWVIPHHKKGAKNDLNNYRGVCLLPLASRLIARIFATRLRNWSEDIGVLDENQNGFPSGRSTADSTQAFIRVDEETRRVMGPRKKADEVRPGAVLLDITKAYPRVNKPLLWKILQRLGMPEKVLTVLRCLHEETIYRVKGREDLSTTWLPQRGLREGCATSPILFNVYHAEVMRSAQTKRRQDAETRGMECGLRWNWRKGGSLPPLSVRRATRSANREAFMVTDSLFADDSTLLGWNNELVTGKEVVKAAMAEYEEKCHDGKEERVDFGSHECEKTRMLGTRIGRKRDLQARLSRGNHAWCKVKRWLWKSDLTKRTQAVIAQATVEATLLFDCNVHAWTKSEIVKLQRVADIAYRWIWNEGKGLARIRMQKQHVNAYNIRKQLQISSIRSKIEIRTLQRIGHVLRMPNERAVKKLILGNWEKEATTEGNLRGGTISYWRRLLREAGVDWTNVENLTKDRKEWRRIIQGRRTFLMEWESKMSERRSNEATPTRSQHITQSEEEEWICRWENCGKVCKNKTGRSHHERMMHREKTEPVPCPKCGETFTERSNVTNHLKNCDGAPSNECGDCGASVTRSNKARHKKYHCKPKK